MHNGGNLTAMALLVEIGNFKRLPATRNFVSYLELLPQKDSNSPDENRLGITKAGNSHVLKFLIEASQSYGKGLSDINHKP